MFTPVETTLGALLMQRASTMLLFNNGKVLGASGILRRSITQPNLQDVSVLGGMLCGVAIVSVFLPQLKPDYVGWSLTSIPILSAIAVGFFTGWGTKNGAGCTSGHMLCGLSRLSARSFIATATFFVTALVTANLVTPSAMEISCISPITGAPSPCYLPVYPSSSDLSTLSTIVFSALSLSLLPSHLPSLDKAAARTLTSFTTGTLFSLALLISGMASPQKVLQFFSFLPSRLNHFDPSLALILVFGVLPSVIYNNFFRGFDNPPSLASVFSFPQKTSWSDWDARFILGNVVFGVCWGASGICPGPGMVRSILQPLWGAIWLSAYWLGSVVPI